MIVRNVVFYVLFSYLKIWDITRMSPVKLPISRLYKSMFIHELVCSLYMSACLIISTTNAWNTQTQLILRPFYGQLVHVIRPRQSTMEDPFVKYVPGWRDTMSHLHILRLPGVYFLVTMQWPCKYKWHACKRTWWLRCCLCLFVLTYVCNW